MFYDIFEDNRAQVKFKKRWKSKDTIPLQNIHIEESVDLKNCQNPCSVPLGGCTVTTMKKTYKSQALKKFAQRRNPLTGF